MGGDGWPNQLFIHPDECIDCGACEPECPWQAIYEEMTTPAIFQDDIALNSLIRNHAHEFVVAQAEPKSHPSPEQVEANKRLWGVARAAS
jgi:ferredoxin